MAVKARLEEEWDVKGQRMFHDMVELLLSAIHHDKGPEGVVCKDESRDEEHKPADQSIRECLHKGMAGRRQ